MNKCNPGGNEGHNLSEAVDQALYISGFGSRQMLLQMLTMLLQGSHMKTLYFNRMGRVFKDAAVHIYLSSEIISGSALDAQCFSVI